MLAASTIAAAVLTTAAGCPENGSPPAGDRSAAVSASWAMASETPVCTVTVTWVLEPVALTGMVGTDTAVTEHESLNAQAAAGVCTFNWGASGVRKGQWRMRTDYLGTCTVVLRDTVTYVRMNDCTQSPPAG